MPRRAFPSFAVLALPALLLAGCGHGGSSEPPLPPAALKAVSDDPGVARDTLARAVDALFTRDDVGETRAVLVLHDGTTAAERYEAGYGPKTKFLGWSMSKTVTGVLIGVLVAEGRLRLDDSPPIPAWQRPGDPRGEITLRQLLQMGQQILARQDRMDARLRLRRRAVDAADEGMAMRAAHESGMEHAGKMNVVDEPRPTAQKIRILEPPGPVAGNRRRHLIPAARP